MRAEQPDLATSIEGRVPAEVASILAGFASASTRLRAALETAPIEGQLGATGETNVQDEATAKLDEVANDLFKRELSLPSVFGLISEEDAEPTDLGSGEYLCCFDPLDGSSNIGVANVGSVMGVYTGAPDLAFEQPIHAREQLVAAAFAVYGVPSTMIVATKAGVDGFTFDPDSGQWCRSFPDVCIPPAIYTSVNWTYRPRWPDNVAAGVDAASEGLRGRYSGSMVEDVLRVLLSGGIFFYPEDSTAASGKLRMLYEVCPIGLIMEKAGGAASDGTRPVLDVPVTSPHQRSPFIVGTVDTVERYRAAHQGEA